MIERLKIGSGWGIIKFQNLYWSAMPWAVGGWESLGNRVGGMK